MIRFPGIAELTGTARRAVTIVNAQGIDAEEDRSRDRHTRIFLTSTTFAISKFVSTVSLLVSVPLTLSYLGPERYGLWMTIGSLIALLGFADFGLGNGLVNAVARANGIGSVEGIKKLVATAYALLGTVAILLVMIWFAVRSFVPWTDIFNVKSSIAVRESESASTAFALCFALGIIGTVGTKVQQGLQMGFLANVWQIFGSLAGLALTIFAIKLGLGLAWLVAAMAGAPAVVSLLNSAIFFWKTAPSIRPSRRDITSSAAREIAHTGLFFLALQLTAAILFSSDNLVIAHLLGADAIPAFDVPSKMFGVISLLSGALLSPLWPAYRESWSRGDHGWARRTFFRSTIVGVAGALVMSTLFVVLADVMLSAWVGAEVHASFWLVLGLGVWKVLETAGTAVAVLLNGLNVVKAQFVIACVFGITVIPLKIYLVGTFGVAGAAWATVAAYTVCVLLPYAFLVCSVLKRSGHPEAARA